MSSGFAPIQTSIAPLGDALESADAPDFDALLDAAIKHIQAKIGDQHGWTDFNLHDPGVTLLEAVVWAMADLNYRSQVGSHWDRRISLADSPAFMADLPADDNADNKPNDEALDTSDGAAGDGEAGDGEQRHKTASSGAHRRVWMRFVFDYFDQLFPVEPSSGTADLFPLVALLKQRWKAFVRESLEIESHANSPPLETIANRIRISLLEESPDELRLEIARRIRVESDENLESLMAEIGTALGWSPSFGEVLAMAADFPNMEFLPSRFEDQAGGSHVWPPHRSQVLSIQPCTAEDYVTHLHHYLLEHPTRYPQDQRTASQREQKAHRIWVQKGLACGVMWDGQVVTTSAQELPGAISLLVDPYPRCCPFSDSDEQAKASETHLELLKQWRLAFYAAEPVLPPEQVRCWGHDELNSGIEINRCLCDQLCIGVVGRCIVHLRGRILHDPELRSQDVQVRVIDRLSDLFYFGIDNMPDQNAAAVPQQTLRGWQPGAAIKLADIGRLLQDMPGVEQVADLAIATDKGDWQAAQLDLPAFTVPQQGDWTLLFQSVTNAS